MSFVTHFESPFIHTWWNVNMPLQFSHAFAIFICVCNFHVSLHGSYVDVCNSHMHLQFSCAFDIFIIGSPNNADGYQQQREWKQSNCYFNDNSSALCGFQCITHEILYFFIYSPFCNQSLCHTWSLGWVLLYTLGFTWAVIITPIAKTWWNHTYSIYDFYNIIC